MSSVPDVIEPYIAFGKLLLPLIAVGLILIGRLTIRRIRRGIGRF
jgi:hypothetical protein